MWNHTFSDGLSMSIGEVHEESGYLAKIKTYSTERRN